MSRLHRYDSPVALWALAGAVWCAAEVAKISGEPFAANGAVLILRSTPVCASVAAALAVDAASVSAPHSTDLVDGLPSPLRRGRAARTARQDLPAARAEPSHIKVEFGVERPQGGAVGHAVARRAVLTPLPHGVGRR